MRYAIAELEWGIQLTKMDIASSEAILREDPCDEVQMEYPAYIAELREKLADYENAVNILRGSELLKGE